MVRGIAFFGVALVLTPLLHSETVEVGDAPFAMPPIEVASFPQKDFRITDYGAKCGEKCTASFASAFEACARSGGGRVVVPPGRWVTGAIHLRSGCELHFEDGAELAFTDDPADYLPAVPTAWEGIECRNLSPLVYAYGCTNVAITGKGLIRPEMARWRLWFRRPPSHTAALDALAAWGATNAPACSRDLTRLSGSQMRPHLIQFNRSRNVRLEGFRIKGSPFWTIHLYHSENCIVRGLDVFAHGHNNDGIDVDMTRNVLIEDCRFDQADDGLAVKAGRNQDAWRLNRPSENVVMRNCRFAFADTLLAIGSELSGGIRNVWVHDCTIEHPYNVCKIKTNPMRGGFVENVTVENVTAGILQEAVFALQASYFQAVSGLPKSELRVTPVNGVTVRNVKAECANWMFNVAPDEKCPPQNMRFENLRLESVRKGYSANGEIAGAVISNVTVGNARPKPPMEVYDWVPYGGKGLTQVIEEPGPYNAWPMIASIGSRLVCVFSRGHGHEIAPGERGVCSSVSDDGGNSWSPRALLANDPTYGEVSEGAGNDSNGAALFWIRCCGRKVGLRHDLYRTVDGVKFERLASLLLDPAPMQVTGIFHVPGKGLMSLWFAGTYRNGRSEKSWGTLTSPDDGRTWRQRVVESGLDQLNWPTEQAAVSIGGGRIVALARREVAGKPLFSLTSSDGGETWTRRETAICDTRESTPALLLDATTGRITLYYYQRGPRQLKRRTADAEAAFASPLAWSSPEILQTGREERPYDAGNVTATAVGKTHHLSYYTGSAKDTMILSVAIPAP